MKRISLLLFLAFAPRTWAGEIVQPQSSGALNLYDFAPLGQTFTAEDPRISSIGVYISGGRTNFTTQLTYSLLTGAGIDGTLLGTSSITVTNSFRGYADVDFSSVTLTVGQTYSVLVTANNVNFLADWNQIYSDLGGDAFPGRIDYTGGESIVSGELNPNNDLTFRIEPIPEPGAPALLLTAGFCLLTWSRLWNFCRAFSDFCPVLSPLALRLQPLELPTSSIKQKNFPNL